MLQPVSVGTKSLADYTHLAGRPLIQEIRERAEALRGLRVLQSGYLRSYALWVAVGVVGLLVYFLTRVAL